MDALRGLAFLGVLCTHVSNVTGDFPGKTVLYTGRYGVQLFFLVSAVTLGLSFARRGRVEQFPLRNFYTRRFFRIAPLFWAGAAFYLMAWDTGPSAFAPEGIKAWHVALTLVFLHGWAPTSISSVVPGGWSIAAEWMFYLCLPFLFRRLSSVSAAVSAAVVAAVVSIGISRLAVFMLPYLGGPYDPDLIAAFLYLWFPSQLPVFLTGLAVYRIIEKPALIEKLRVGARPAILLAVALSFMVAFAYLKPGLVPRYMFFTVALALLVLSLMARPFRFFVNPAVCGLGTISFSCYIVHFAVLKALDPWFKSWTFSLISPAFDNAVRFGAVLAITLAITAALSLLTYRLIEQPGIRLGSSIIKRREAIPVT